MNKFKSVLKMIGIAVGALLMLFAAYFIYLFVSYERIEDRLNVGINAPLSGSNLNVAKKGTEYTITTFNIGFGAYSKDFDFFMDGGKKSWAESKESVRELTEGAADCINRLEPDIALFQEVDFDSTRSYHVNQVKMLGNAFPDYNYTFALNYNSPFLLYPLYQPHGASKAGLVSMSTFAIKECIRRSLPISESVKKIIDLDRAYTVNRIPAENGKELVVINIHMSAYGSDENVRSGQTGMLRDEIEAEYQKGNYVIVGGDFNHDLKLKEDKPAVFWAHFYDRNLLPEHFSFAIDSFSDVDLQEMENTCRDSGVPYDPETTYTVTVDGFIISDNIEITDYENLQTGYEYSDHNPVVMKFKLK
ncbi:MAG: endonuclease/exonuclease/phosphatase family protein [Lachnospiraceae bacterium]|nr:endonuclease/exonuclease/phosphatase family protein [Lachnospiraceae bacterium]